MKKLKVLIVEDDINELKMLDRNLKLFSDSIDLTSISIANSYEEALFIMKSGNEFDLSILDYFLEKKNSLDLVRDTENDRLFGAIFLKTTEDEKLEELKQIAVFEDRGIFLLDNGYYTKSLKKAFEKLISYNNERYVPKISEAQISKDRIAVEIEENEFISIEAKDILLIEVMGKTCYIHYLVDNQVNVFKKKGTLAEYENALDGKMFFRIHDSYLVNILAIKSYKDSNIELKFSLRLADTTERSTLPVSSRRETQFKKFFGI